MYDIFLIFFLVLNMTNKTTAESPVKPNIQYTDSKFTTHHFIKEILNKKFLFETIKMQESLFIYVNEKDHSYFSELSLAMKNQYDNTSIGTSLLGKSVEDCSKNLACKLSKRISKVVFLSCNFEQNSMLIPHIEKSISDEIKNKPEYF